MCINIGSLNVIGGLYQDPQDLVCLQPRIQFTRVQKATPVGGTVQIKQLIVVPDRVLCTRDFVLQKYRTQFVYDYTCTVHQLTGLTGQNMEVLNQPYSGQLA